MVARRRCCGRRRTARCRARMFRSSTRDFYGVLTSATPTTRRAARACSCSTAARRTATSSAGRRCGRRRRRTTTPAPASGSCSARARRRCRPGRVGSAAVGLGAGTLAAYARPGDVYRFYEISPIRRAHRARRVHLPRATPSDRGATVDIVLGDGRLSLGARARRPAVRRARARRVQRRRHPGPPADAEAFELYRRHLKPDGVLCVHVSNHYLGSSVVAAAAAARWGGRRCSRDSRLRGRVAVPREWVLLGPTRATIAASSAGADGMRPAAGAGRLRPWTDEHANVLRIVRRDQASRSSVDACASRRHFASAGRLCCEAVLSAGARSRQNNRRLVAPPAPHYNRRREQQQRPRGARLPLRRARPRRSPPRSRGRSAAASASPCTATSAPARRSSSAASSAASAATRAPSPAPPSSCSTSTRAAGSPSTTSTPTACTAPTTSRRSASPSCSSRAASSSSSGPTACAELLPADCVHVRIEPTGEGRRRIEVSRRAVVQCKSAF